MVSETARPPIPGELVSQHIEQAAAGLARIGADGLLVFRRSNILAFCGVPLEPSDRLVCGLISRDGQVAFVVPAFEAGMAATLPPGSEMLAWDEHEDPYEVAGRAASLLGIATGTLVLDKFTWLQTERQLAEALPSCRLIPDTDLIESIRIIKSSDELTALRGACEDTGRIYPLIAKRLAAGLSEIELQQMVISDLRRAGVFPYGDLIQGGENASIPHQPAGSRRFREGDAVIVDFVAARDGYASDMTRTFAVGDVSSEIKDAYRVVRAAQAAAIAAVRPGVSCESVDQAARRIIEDAGLGDYFVHRVGHGIGLDIHEPPYLVRGNLATLRPGMCMTIEPGVYVPSQFGIRIEDVVVVTTDGCEVLTHGVPTDFSAAFKSA